MPQRTHSDFRSGGSRGGRVCNGCDDDPPHSPHVRCPGRGDADRVEDSGHQTSVTHTRPGSHASTWTPTSSSSLPRFVASQPTLEQGPTLAASPTMDLDVRRSTWPSRVLSALDEVAYVRRG